MFNTHITKVVFDRIVIEIEKEKHCGPVDLLEKLDNNH